MWRGVEEAWSPIQEAGRRDVKTAARSHGQGRISQGVRPNCGNVVGKLSAGMQRSHGLDHVHAPGMPRRG